MRYSQTMSTGTQFATMARKNAGISSRTTRNATEIKRDILEAIRNATCIPGYYSEAKTELFRAAYPSANAWMKFVDGYRIDGLLARTLRELTPWQFAGFIGTMIDAGITNNGQAEQFFAEMSSVNASLAA